MLAEILWEWGGIKERIEIHTFDIISGDETKGGVSMFKTHNLSRNSAVLFVVANHVDGVEVELKVGHLNTDRRNISVKLGFALSLQVLAGRRERWVVLGGGFAFAFSISRGSGSRHNEVDNGTF